MPVTPMDMRVLELVYTTGQMGVNPKSPIGQYVQSLQDEYAKHLRKEPSLFGSKYKVSNANRMLNSKTIEYNNRGVITRTMQKNMNV
jgi:hypothetical protein